MNFKYHTQTYTHTHNVICMHIDTASLESPYYAGCLEKVVFFFPSLKYTGASLYINVLVYLL